MHDKIEQLQSHLWTAFHPGTSAVLDGIVFCDAHKHRVVEFNCLDCSKLICLLCLLDPTTHKLHDIESVAEADGRRKQLHREANRKFEEATDEMDSNLRRRVESLRASQNDYDAARREIDRNVEEEVERVKAEGKRKREALDDDQCVTENKAKVVIDELRKKIKCRRRILGISNLILQRTNEASHMMATEDGLLQFLKENSIKEEERFAVTTVTTVVFRSVETIFPPIK